MKPRIKILTYNQNLFFLRKKVLSKDKAFSLLEMIIVIMMVGILMMATTVYIGGNEERRKVIEAEGCMNSIGSEINNFIFYTLTSKKLKINNSKISPSYYVVEFTGGIGDYCSSGNMCNKINLSYSTSTGHSPSNMISYEIIDSSNKCAKDIQLKYYRDELDTKYIIMNKGFTPKSINDKNVFYLSGSEKKLLGDVIIGLCLNDTCTPPKEIGKFVADARSQTISVRNCKFYDSTDPTKCKTREGCQIYSGTDPTVCLQY